ncbi:EpsG family protein [Enterobacter huaxiensis]|uniref:EpsG family protein n=1 Tax=Enterobacter huaxiensis TaxID=2494702 RepID=UPI002175AA1F|nr:EpsG family protein [Enterobacter huaxiensis]MCS5449768.1 EpsG family protein [Enterobacter huaxiensis]
MQKIKLSSLVLFLVGLALILISGFKPIGLDRDSVNYVNMIQNSLEFDDLYLREPAFNLLQLLNFLLFDKSITSFFLIFATLGITFKLIAISRASSSPILSLLVYVFFYYILHDLTQIRVGVASGLFLLAVNDRVEGQNKNAFIKLCLAVCFHYSALLAFVIFMLSKDKINRKIYFFLPIAGVIISLILNVGLLSILSQYLPGFLSAKINAYLAIQNNDSYNQINIFNFYYTILMLIYVSLLLFMGNKINPKDFLYIKILGVGLFSFYAFSIFPVMAFRISEFFCIVIIILFANIASNFKQPYIYKVGIFVFGIGYFISQGLMHNINL